MSMCGLLTQVGKGFWLIVQLAASGFSWTHVLPCVHQRQHVGESTGCSQKLTHILFVDLVKHHL